MNGTKISVMAGVMKDLVMEMCFRGLTLKVKYQAMAFTSGKTATATKESGWMAKNKAMASGKAPRAEATQVSGHRTKRTGTEFINGQMATDMKVSGS